jgi:hypothetical protein
MNIKSKTGSVLCNMGYISLVAAAVTTTAGLSAAAGAESSAGGVGIWPFIIGGSALSMAGTLLITWGISARVAELAEEVAGMGRQLDDMERNRIHLREVDDLIQMNNEEVRRREIDDRFSALNTSIDSSLNDIRHEISTHQKTIEVRGVGRRADSAGT